MSRRFDRRAIGRGPRFSSYDPYAALLGLSPELLLLSTRNVTIDGTNPNPGDDVSNWGNYAPPVHNFSQGGVWSNQPSFDTALGIPQVEFPVAPATTFLLSSAEVWPAGTDHTFAIVYRPDVLADAFFLDASVGRLIIRMNVLGQYVITAGADRTTVEAPIVAGAWQWMAMSCNTGAGVCQIWHNGVALTPLVYNARAFGGNVAIGRHVSATSFYYRGGMAMILTKPVNPTVSELRVIAKAVNDLYNLPLGVFA
jgi:hypothetical protein